MANELKSNSVKALFPLKLKSISMQTLRIGQAVILLMIVAMAASCAASKEYTSKLFAPRTPAVTDSQAMAFRFLDLDSAAINTEGWVTTDIIMGRDTISNTLALDKLANTFPSSPVAVDTIVKMGLTKKNQVVTSIKTIPEESIQVAKNINPGEVRNKRTRE